MKKVSSNFWRYRIRRSTLEITLVPMLRVGTAFRALWLACTQSLLSLERTTTDQDAECRNEDWLTTQSMDSRPNRAYSGGSTNRFSSVDEQSPPRITTASGYSIS